MKIVIGYVSLNGVFDQDIYEHLVFSGFPVIVLDKFGKLHDYVSSGGCNTVVISSKILKKFDINPIKHLWDSISTVIIVEYSKTQDNDYKYKLHAIPKDVHKYKYQNDPNEVLRKIKKGIFRGRNQKKDFLNSLVKYNLKATLPGSYSPEVMYKDVFNEKPILNIHLTDEQRKLMTPKLWSLLHCLEQNHETGSSVKDIEKSLWFNIDTRKNRQNDIQSYISKLRKIITTESYFSYSIKYESKRYYIVKTYPVNCFNKIY